MNKLKSEMKLNQEIFNKNLRKNKNGFVLVMSVLILTALLMIGTYLIAISNSEIKINKAHFTATKNYYLAEAGIGEMIWKIQNDEATRIAFMAGSLSSSNSINRTNVFGDSNASYQVAAISTVEAEASIIATSTYQLGNSASRRVVKSYISRATSDNQEWAFSSFAGGRGSQQNGNFLFTGSGVVLTANGGRLHANQVFKVQGAEIVVNNGIVSASNVIDVVAGGRLTLNSSWQDAPTSTIPMLQIDFDSASADSWKNRATDTYTASQFNSLPSGTTLNGIIYVNGDIDITNKNITINGVLVCTNDVDIKNTDKTLRINADLIYGGGLLAKNNIDIETSGGEATIDGLVYAGNNLVITNSGTNFTVNGSLTGFDARINGSGSTIELNYNQSNFDPVINPEYNQTSPVIQIDHWEEEY